MTHDVAVLVPPAPTAPLGAMATAALLAERGRSVALLEPTGAPDTARPEEPFLLPLPPDGRSGGADGLLALLAAATRLPPLDRILERPPVPCQLILPRQRLDLATDPAAFAIEIAREWPEAAPGLAALERRLGDLDAAVAAAPPRLLVGSPTRLGQAGDLFAFLRRPGPWLKGRAALRAQLPAIPDPAAARGLAALAVGLGGLAQGVDLAADFWRPWAAARRGARPLPGGPGLVGQLRARAIAAGAVPYTYDPDGLAVAEAQGGLAVHLGGDTAPLETRLLASGWPAAGLAPRTAGRSGARLTRLAALSAPALWAARLTVEAPRDALPVGLGSRAILADEGQPLLLEVATGAPGEARLRLTALLERPAAEPDLVPALRRHLERLIPFLPADAPASLTPPDPRWPARFAPVLARPVAIPPLAGRGLALVGPDVAPSLGPEGEIVAALAVAGAFAPGRG